MTIFAEIQPEPIQQHHRLIIVELIGLELSLKLERIPSGYAERLERELVFFVIDLWRRLASTRRFQQKQIFEMPEARQINNAD